MQVHQILRSKGDYVVVTIKPDATVSEASEILSSRRIGALVVSPDGKRVSGIISERDVVRELGRSGSGCLSGKVSDYMTKKISSCRNEDSVDEIMQRMTEGRFRHMPVVDGDEMIGLISIGDVVKARLSELSMEKEALEGMIKGF